MAIRQTWDEYHALHQRLWGTPGITPPVVQKEVKQKYGNKFCVVDGKWFRSLLEARCYSEYKLLWLAGHVTEPLLQVPFSLGRHYGRERRYISDLVCIDLHTGALLVVDAKGHKTREYLQKKRVFEQLYGITITEWTDKKK